MYGSKVEPKPPSFFKKRFGQSLSVTVFTQGAGKSDNGFAHLLLSHRGKVFYGGIMALHLRLLSKTSKPGHNLRRTLGGQFQHYAPIVKFFKFLSIRSNAFPHIVSSLAGLGAYTKNTRRWPGQDEDSGVRVLHLVNI